MKCGVSSFRSLAVSAALFLFTSSLTCGQIKPASNATLSWADERRATFDAVWTTVNESYFDPTFGGVDWKKKGDDYRAQLPDATTPEQLRRLLQQLLLTLNRSHFAILPREMAVFTPKEQARHGEAGVTVTSAEGKVAIANVREGSTAWRAGLRPGQIIESIGGISVANVDTALSKAGIEPVQRAKYLSGLVAGNLVRPVGESLKIETVRPNQTAQSFSVDLESHPGDWSEPMGNFPSMPVECQAERGNDGIGYLRFNSFVPPIMKEARKLIRTLQPHDGLIIDLRGNPGGLGLIAPALCGWLFDQEVSLGAMYMRQGQSIFQVHPQTGAFLGPIAVLIDGGSASTSEILAAGLKELHRARVFGEKSAGNALPSAFKVLPTGDLFQFAIADLKTPLGAPLEGVGVAPDETMPRSLDDLASGRDRALAAARAWLETQRSTP